VILLRREFSGCAKLRLLAPSLCRYLSERRWQVKFSFCEGATKQETKSMLRRKKVRHLSTRTLVTLRNLYEDDRFAGAPSAADPFGAARSNPPYTPCSSLSARKSSRISKTRKPRPLKIRQARVSHLALAGHQPQQHRSAERDARSATR